MFLIMASFLFACNNPQTNNEGLNQFAEVKYNNRLPLDSFAVAIQHYYQLPGLAVAKMNSSGIEEFTITGKNKTQNGVLLNRNSKFQIGSCGKSFTALLVATFVEDDTLNWDTKISDVFTDMQIYKDYRDVTLRQLLSHTAGLQQFWTDDEVFNIRNTISGLKGSTVEKRKIFTQWNLSRHASFSPGEHHYSNGGYIIVAAMLEELTGKPYEKLMEQRVFRPLKLNTAEFGYPFLADSTQPHRHMNRNEAGTGITMDAQTRMPDPIFNPSGFISLSIEDFARYVIFHIQVLKGAETVINSRVVRELFKPVIRIDNNNEIGMGWQIISVNGTKTYGHTGSDGTIRSAMSINPKAGKAVVFATNIGDQRSEQALINVILELLNL